MKICPVFTLMEKEVIQVSLKLMGYPIRGEGIMTPSSNISIMYAMMLAKKNVLDQVKTKELYGNVPLTCVLPVSVVIIPSGQLLIGWALAPRTFTRYYLLFCLLNL